ncbi:MAG: hypothetical protein JNK33_04530 [Candidatus Doudnabacteria bacterium]|nr:hypothetical protein [Candidatus Doudnabacteria bacterium]
MERANNINVNRTDAKIVFGIMAALAVYWITTALACWRAIGYGKTPLNTVADWTLFVGAGVTLSISLVAICVAINQVCYMKGITNRNLSPLAGWLQLALAKEPSWLRTTAWVCHSVGFVAGFYATISVPDSVWRGYITPEQSLAFMSFALAAMIASLIWLTLNACRKLWGSN